MSLKFTKDHEWINLDGDIATVGVTAYALGQLGDLVFVEVPDEGRMLSKGDEAAVVESVKAASEVYAPVSGEVIEGNAGIADDPATVSGDPAEDGWFFKIRLSDPSELDDLMDEEEYDVYVESLD
ncbi:glycine cleavage system protein GcvH [Magnetovibrio blakemorei]|uniref:Glycine cleavage system H protein n=1 Tax=Magnetovibrio blakemorei TaxID=28181 RepID=A0A1E5Q7H8_9PROT|nr:glycine cleavage system protein GcvH [Magnetovibrio blakemorei]OEJ67127.1 glycine cleavage system protein H [Magnetovibrio blakemorei]